MSERPGGRPPLRVAFVCERCDRPLAYTVDGAADGADCPGCGARQALGVDAGTAASGVVRRCLRCGLDRLYVQKDFNRRIGLAVFALAAILSVPTWGLSLLVATLVDWLLYHLLGEVTICYACRAQHRGGLRNPEHGPFDLHVQEAVDRAPRPA